MASVFQPVGSDLITQYEEPFVGSEMKLRWPWVAPRDTPASRLIKLKDSLAQTTSSKF